MGMESKVKVKVRVKVRSEATGGTRAWITGEPKSKAGNEGRLNAESADRR